MADTFPRVRLTAMVVVLAVTVSPVAAEPLSVVVRTAGDPLAVARLRGQLADLDLHLLSDAAPLEPTLDAQLATAAQLAEAHHARAVVWFVPRGRGVAVAIATPADHRLFVREIPAGDASSVAEAAAVAARGALRAISLGGTIGVEVERADADAPALDRPAVVERAPSREPPPAPTRTSLEAELGWQIALDGGADPGAHALAQRTTVARGPWAVSLALALGAPLRDRSDAATVELSRSGAELGVERRIGAFAIGASAGALLYHRTTVTPPDGLAPTPAASTLAFVAGPELRWQWRPGGGHVGIAACAALDIVAGAPDFAVARAGTVESLGALGTLQPRFSLGVFARLP